MGSGPQGLGPQTLTRIRVGMKTQRHLYSKAKTWWWGVFLPTTTSTLSWILRQQWGRNWIISEEVFLRSQVVKMQEKESAVVLFAHTDDLFIEPHTCTPKEKFAIVLEPIWEPAFPVTCGSVWIPPYGCVCVSNTSSQALKWCYYTQ